MNPPTLEPPASPKSGGFLDPKKNLKVAGKLVAVALLLVVIFFAATRLLGGRNRDSANVILSKTPVGKVLVSWPERAESTLRTMLDGASGPTIAATVQNYCHPSGKGGALEKYEIRRVGNQLSVSNDVSWKGGLSGSAYTTRVIWEFDKDKHIRAAVTGDNAPVAASAANLQKLDEYFRTEAYAVLRSNMKD